MSEISNIATGQVFAQEGGGFLVLLTINHASMAAPIRVVNNTVNITSNGNLFIAYPFDLTLPVERERSAMRCRLTIDNVSREIAQIVRNISTPPTVAIEIIRMDDLNAVEITLPVFKLRNVEWDTLQLTGDLLLDDSDKEAFPQRSFSPSEYPGLFS